MKRTFTISAQYVAPVTTEIKLPAYELYTHPDLSLQNHIERRWDSKEAHPFILGLMLALPDNKHTRSFIIELQWLLSIISLKVSIEKERTQSRYFRSFVGGSWRTKGDYNE